MRGNECHAVLQEVAAVRPSNSRCCLCCSSRREASGIKRHPGEPRERFGGDLSECHAVAELAPAEIGQAVFEFEMIAVGTEPIVTNVRVGPRRPTPLS